MDNNENMNVVELNAEDLEEVSGGKGGKNKLKATGDVRVRKGAGLGYAEMGILSKGDTYAYLGNTKRDDRGVAWYQINYNGAKGWVSSKYSKLV